MIDFILNELEYITSQLKEEGRYNKSAQIERLEKLIETIKKSQGIK